MLIPKDLYELCASGRAFRLSVTTDTGAVLSYARKRIIPIVNPQMVDVNGLDAASHEVETVFRLVEDMTMAERAKAGVAIKGDLLWVAVKGQFAKSFDAKSHASQTTTAYCPKDGVRGSNRAHAIKRPSVTAPAKPVVDQNGNGLNLIAMAARAVELANQPPVLPAPESPPVDTRTPLDLAALELAARTLDNQARPPVQDAPWD